MQIDPGDEARAPSGAEAQKPGATRRVTASLRPELMWEGAMAKLASATARANVSLEEAIALCRRTKPRLSTPTGAPPTIFPSARSISSTIPLLREPLKEEHIKPRLLGHWGTTPGLNFIYAHLNRLIKKLDLDMIYVTGPGHGGPGMVANAYLEGTYSEVYPNISEDEEGMKRLFTQFSFPGGIPSHVAPETPGSIHEGGELGYSMSHAHGAAFDNPDLIVACVIGDGEAETGPLATSWHSNKFLNPVRDGAVLPILHLNGYKIANPTVLARIPHDELDHLMRGYGYTPHFVEGDDPDDDARADGGDARNRRQRHPRASRPTRGATGSPSAPPGR